MLLGSFLRPATAGQSSRVSGRATEITKSLDEFRDKIIEDKKDLTEFKQWKPADRAKKKITDQIEVCLLVCTTDTSFTNHLSPPLEIYLEQDAEHYRIGILKTINTFSQLSEDQLRTAADSLEEVDYVKGDVIIQQDDVGDSFFLLEDGIVSVLKKSSHNAGEGATKELARLGKNSHFGDGKSFIRQLVFI